VRRRLPRTLFEGFIQLNWLSNGNSVVSFIFVTAICECISRTSGDGVTLHNFRHSRDRTASLTVIIAFPLFARVHFGGSLPRIELFQHTEEATRHGNQQR